MKKLFLGILLLITSQLAFGAGSFVDLFTIGKVSSSANKVLDFSDGAQKGSIRYNFANGVMEVADDGTNFRPIGEGGSLDLWYSENFETLKEADIVSGSNSTFLGGGVLDGSIEITGSIPLSKLKSFKYTAGASSLNDYFALPAQSLDRKQVNNDSGVTFYYTWDDPNSDPEVVVWDVTNSQKINSVLDVVKNKGSPTRYSSTFYPPSGSASVQLGFHFVSAPASGAILEFDDVEFSTDPYIYKPLLAEQSSFYQEYLGYGSIATKIPYFQPAVSEKGSGIYTVTNDSTDGLVITALRDAVITIHANGYSSGGIFYGVSKNSSELTVNIESITSTSDRYCMSFVSGWTSQVSCSIDVKAGDILRPHSNANFNLTTQELRRRGTVTISAYSTSEHIVTPQKSYIESYSTNYSTNFWNSTGSTQLYDFTRFGVPSTSPLVSVGDDGSVTKITAKKRVIFFGNLSSEAGNDHIIGMNRGGSISETLAFAQMGTGHTQFDQNISGTCILEAGDWISVSTSNAYSQRNGAFNFTVVDLEGQILAATPVQKIAYIKDVKSSGTAGGTFNSGSWQTRDLNTVTGDASIVSLSSNQFTLGPGKYKIEFKAPASRVNSHAAKLRNITDSTDEIIGNMKFGPAATENEVTSDGADTIEIFESKTFEIQHYCQTTKATNGFGIPGIAGVSGIPNVFTQVKITKLR